MSAHLPRGTADESFSAFGSSSVTMPSLLGRIVRATCRIRGSNPSAESCSVAAGYQWGITTQSHVSLERWYFKENARPAPNQPVPRVRSEPYLAPDQRRSGLLQRCRSFARPGSPECLSLGQSRKRYCAQVEGWQACPCAIGDSEQEALRIWLVDEIWYLPPRPGLVPARESAPAHHAPHSLPASKWKVLRDEWYPTASCGRDNAQRSHQPQDELNRFGKIRGRGSSRCTAFGPDLGKPECADQGNCPDRLAASARTGSSCDARNKLRKLAESARDQSPRVHWPQCEIGFITGKGELPNIEAIEWANLRSNQNRRRHRAKGLAEIWGRTCADSRMTSRLRLGHFCAKELFADGR
jgi:hypothetical protein